MLNIVLGRAGTGKTDYIMNDIKRRMETGETGMLLIVPEQYSHDAERQLCAVCGDRLSLHAETLSFTRLCSNVLSETGNAAHQQLAKSGQILAMFRALESVAPALKVFGIKRMRTEVIIKLLEAVEEFKSLNIAPQALEKAADQTSNPLSDKLRDLALIYDAYDALLQLHGDDAAKRLTLLADCISESTVGNTGHIYFDGFNDFTAQEISVIEELLRKKANLTFCLTCDMDDTGEIFNIPQRTVTQLRRLALETGHETGDGSVSYHDEIGDGSVSYSSPCDNDRAPELIFLEKHLFDDSPPKFPAHDANGQSGTDVIKLYKAPTRYVECEYAACEVRKLVRSGYRWRDISVMARNWEEYSSVCENVFEKYGIPYFTGGKVDILSKPPMTLIDAALEIATFGWEYKSVFRYLKSGLIDITSDQCAMLENYVLKWQIRGTLWTKEWIMPPRGYGKLKADDEEQLKQINELRRVIVKPLLSLREGLKGESAAEVKLRVLYGFLEEIKLPQSIMNKADEYNERGELRLSDEYQQLWDITIDAMDQMYTIIGDDMLSATEFHKLFNLAMSQNNVGVIPVSLDRTPLGGMAMSRRRDLKCLILLGATDDNLPSLGKSTGALSENERMTLRKLGTEILAGMEERLYREMNMLYSTLAQPSKKLVLIYSTGEKQRPSFINKRLSEVFSVTEETLGEEDYMSAAIKPYKELLQLQGISLDHGDSADIFIKQGQQGDSPSANIARQSANLSKQSALKLYGNDFSLSATRVDSFYSCPYKFFLKNGLKLEPRVPAEFDALAAGNFMHYILDSVFNEVKSGVGFKDIDEKSCTELTDRYMSMYENEVLLGFEGKNTRFEYLFKRHKADVKLVVLDMLKELGKSSFEPLDLELDMSTLSDTERGFIDRVDGFDHEGKLYLRVIDYKTRKKAYSLDLNDVLYGRDMQMLIYMFALKKYGSKKYGKEIKPAGVLYVPARDVIISTSRNASEDEINKQRSDEMRRNGLIIDDPAIIEAMENSPVKEYLPVKISKDGCFTGDSLVNEKQIGLLSDHVSTMLQTARDRIRNGDNECSPYYKSENDNACSFCEYHAVCGFDEELGDRLRFARKMKREEVWEELERLKNGIIK